MDIKEENENQFKGVCNPCYIGKHGDCRTCAYKLRDFSSAVNLCATREAIFRNSEPHKRYYKNNSISLDDRVHELDKKQNDWRVYDPRECY